MSDQATKREFLACLLQTPPQNRLITAVFAELDADDRDRLGPAFDLYVQASDLMDEVRRLRGMAYKTGQAELVEELSLRPQKRRPNATSRHRNELERRLAAALGQEVEP